MVDRFCGPWLLPGFCCPPPPRGTLGSDLCAHGLASVPSVGGGGAIVLLYRPSTPSSPPPPFFFSFEAWGFAVPSSYAHRPLASLPPSLSWGKCSLHTQPLSKVGFPFLFPWEPAFCRVGSTPRVLIDVGRGCISCSLLPPPLLCFEPPHCGSLHFAILGGGPGNNAHGLGWSGSCCPFL